MLLLSFQAIFVLCICFTIVSDFRNLLIPNWIVIVLVSTFVVYAAVYLEPKAALVHFGLAIVVFIFATAFFVFNWIAGGDVKFVTAVALWMGPEHTAQFLMLMALAGAALALTLLSIRKYSFLLIANLPHSWVVQRVTTLAEHGQCPYGIAIGIAALLTPSSLFLRGTTL